MHHELQQVVSSRLCSEPENGSTGHSYAFAVVLLLLKDVVQLHACKKAQDLVNIEQIMLQFMPDYCAWATSTSGHTNTTLYLVAFCMDGMNGVFVSLQEGR